MNKIISKLGISRVCLVFFIFLRIMLTSENTYSQHYWVKEDVEVNYNPQKKYITFDCLIYDYTYAQFNDSFLQDCSFEYSENGRKFHHLMSAKIKKQDDKKMRTRLQLTDKRTGENIQLLNSIEPTGSIQWPDGKTLEADVRIIEDNNWKRSVMDRVRRSYMRVRWHFHHSITQIKSIGFRGKWVAIDGYSHGTIDEVYLLDNVKSNSDRLKNDSSAWNSDLSTQLTVTCEKDAINVTGAEPGETIKVYNASGVEAKSVVANDDVVNIKLPKNQIYIVKSGQARYKVAL